MASDALGIFTGAGVSYSAPASLPLAHGIADAVKAACRDSAADLVGNNALPNDLPDWPLEYILGRLRGTWGNDALRALQCLRVEVPNEDHLLLALHLLRGGLIVTVNLDEGIESAYNLLRGSRQLPDFADRFAELLNAWRRGVPDAPGELRVLRSEADFDGWLTSGRPRPCLAKLHGSLDGDRPPIEPVVDDDLELRQLGDLKSTVLDELADCDFVLVTGYAGLDIDVFAPLLERLQPGRFEWACPAYPQTELREEVTRHGGSLAPEGTAGTATPNLRRLLRVEQLPAWPEVTNNDPKIALQRWLDDLASQRDAGADAYAWMLIDARRYDAAISILTKLVDRAPSVGRSIRLAEAYSFRNRGDDRGSARRYYAIAVRKARLRSGERTYALIRIGESFRRDPNVSATKGAIYALGLGVVARLVAIVDDHTGIQRGRADSALGHTLLRVIEAQLARGHGHTIRTRVALTAICSVALSLQRDAIKRSGGGRTAFARQQQIELEAIQSLLKGTTPRESLADEVEALRVGFVRAADLRGVANPDCSRELLSRVQRVRKRVDGALVVSVAVVEGREGDGGGVRDVFGRAWSSRCRIRGRGCVQVRRLMRV